MLEKLQKLSYYNDFILNRTAFSRKGTNPFVDESKKLYGKADQSWEYITTIRDCRNMVVHNGGRIKDDLKPKCDKFNIGYREEDSQLYIEYADVMKFYEAILDFMDRAFRLEPSISTKP